MKKMVSIALVVLILLTLSSCKQKPISPISSDVSSQVSTQSSNSSSSSASSSSSEIFVTAPEVYSYPTEIPEDNEEWVKMITVDTQEPVIESNSSDIIIDGQYKLPVINNIKPLTELLYPTGLNSILSLFPNFDNCAIQQAGHISNNSMHTYPIVFLRQTGEGRYYSVQKIKDGGYLYLFLERGIDMKTGEYCSDDLTDVLITGGVYMEKALTKSDFDSISVGSTIYDVMAIDNAAGMTELYAREKIATTGKRVEIILSKHLLKDGLLVYKYEYSGDTLVVTDIIFSEDFVFISPIMKNEADIGYPKYFGILPQDYPQ